MLINSCWTSWIRGNKLTNSWVTCCFEVEIQHVEQELINMLNFLSESWSTVDQLSLFEGVDGVWEMLINCWSTSMRRTNTTCCTTVDQYVDYLTKSWSTVDENVDFCDQINSWSTVEQLLLTQHCWTTVDQHVEYPSQCWSTVDQQCYFWEVKLINCWSTCWFWSWFMLINCWSTLWPVMADVDQQLINMFNSESTCWSTVDQLLQGWGVFKPLFHLCSLCIRSLYCHPSPLSLQYTWFV